MSAQSFESSCSVWLLVEAETDLVLDILSRKLLEERSSPNAG
jgi:hypothetical protein